MAGAAGLALGGSGIPAQSARNVKAPLAIAMWDFSWLERRWTGGGYEDWNRALDDWRNAGTMRSGSTLSRT